MHSHEAARAEQGRVVDRCRHPADGFIPLVPATVEAMATVLVRALLEQSDAGWVAALLDRIARE